MGDGYYADSMVLEKEYHKDIMHSQKTERFCTNTKCNWAGPEYRTEYKQKLCPLCGNKTKTYLSNDGFLFIGPVPNKQYGQRIGRNINIDDVEWDQHNKPIDPYDGYYMNRDHFKRNLKSGLPKEYHYDGMSKIKGGKGYKNPKDGSEHFKGIESGPCKECEDGTIISLQMNTSSRGFETTSEKVCNKCGLVYPGSFQILDKKPDYKSKHFETHDEWLEYYKQQDSALKIMDDTDADLQNYQHLIGAINDIKDAGVIDLPASHDPIRGFNQSTARLRKAEKRLANTNESKNQPKDVWWNNEYKIIANDYIHELGMNKADAADVHWIIEHKNNMFDTRYKMEDIILGICVFVLGRKYSKQKRGGLITRICSLYGIDKTVLSLVRDKLSS